MNRKFLLLVAGVVIVGAATSAYILYYFGVDAEQLPPPNDGRATPPELDRPNVSVSATYNETAETITVRVEQGQMTAAEYDFLELKTYPGGEGSSTVLRRPNGEPLQGPWADTKRASLTEFPITAGDTVVILTTDGEDDDGDGNAGIESGDSVELSYGTRAGTGRRATLVYWTVEDNRLQRGDI